MLRWRTVEDEFPPDGTRALVRYGAGRYVLGTFRGSTHAELWLYDDEEGRRYLPGFFSGWMPAEEFLSLFAPGEEE